jgi:acyl carrier protein
MDRTEVKQRCQAALAHVFGEKPERFEESTTAADIPKWDSLSHMIMITILEKRFDVRIAPADGVAAKNFGELVDLVTRLKNGKG